jgi:hypothetical protein
MPTQARKLRRTIERARAEVELMSPTGAVNGVIGRRSGFSYRQIRRAMKHNALRLQQLNRSKLERRRAEMIAVSSILADPEGFLRDMGAGSE